MEHDRVTGHRPTTHSTGLPADHRPTLRRMWDILQWSNDTLSISWWFLLLVIIVILAAAGSRAARK